MSIEEQRRKAFDEWHKAEQQAKWESALQEFGLDPEPIPEEFLQAAKLLHWRIWNAALDSVVIKLPIIEPSSTPCLSATKAAFRCAIEAAGLKVMP